MIYHEALPARNSLITLTGTGTGGKSYTSCQHAHPLLPSGGTTPFLRAAGDGGGERAAHLSLGLSAPLERSAGRDHSTLEDYPDHLHHIMLHQLHQRCCRPMAQRIQSARYTSLFFPIPVPGESALRFQRCGGHHVLTSQVRQSQTW